MKTAILIMMVVIVMLALVLIAASVYLYNVSIYRSKKDFMNVDPNLLKTSQPWESATDWLQEQPIRTIQIKSDDGLQLAGHYIPSPEDSNKVVILAHGYSGQGRDMSNFAKLYQELGYHVLMPDDRGHGQSEGHYIGFGWHDRKDYLKWIDYVIASHGEGSQIILHGISMGGATVLMTSGEPLPEQVKCIVSDCAYTSVKDILTYQLKEMYKLPAFPLIPLTSLVCRLRAGYFFGEASALEQVSRTKLPILFIHGNEDRFVPYDMVHRLYEAAGSEKELLSVPHAQHGNAFFADKEGYGSKLTSFVSRYVL
ncbi:alpha/beta hydrolase [Paenibacillus crassostreae]|uniref:Alpha/beta hydrolase n=1 Tax=Paenibacillus crassostreae TaxID=1763538 RepID=A0A167B6Z5_9BACL|nr:alpha/beta hydrolase [Paenibacillus crassostreae]AOZ93117.1 alpha/beta hydrolase [Paenibacillus crassostreae]OAB71794.1 alpha/beta hydrolase [Paenibacillus crassostreae]